MARAKPSDEPTTKPRSASRAAGAEAKAPKPAATTKAAKAAAGPKPAGRAKAAAGAKPTGRAKAAAGAKPTAPAKKGDARRAPAAKAAARSKPAAAPSTPAKAGHRGKRRRSADAFDRPIPAVDDDSPTRLTVRRMHRRDINRVWEFVKLSFRAVNRETVEYQRPRSKERFVESYDDEGVEQLVFEAGDDVVGYAECAFEVTGSDNWINPRYFESRDMRPLFVEELATHPDYQGRGVGSFMMAQLDHLARLRGCTHLVLEVAENNEPALAFYRRRAFYKLDAAVFMARRVEREPDLLPPRELGPERADPSDDAR
jgi:ribosomal protein S18 acetylase RimI-like enzyme